MVVTKANASMISGYPVLELEIDGHPAQVFEPKLTLLEAGLVVLLDRKGYWAANISAEFRTDDGNRVTIRGATTDEQIVALVRRFVAGEEGDLLKS
ncbi:MAG TPA: hypothetical protein VGM54_19685 [Chthoniobacter sp.]|jgi:hypothetical protein